MEPEINKPHGKNKREEEPSPYAEVRTSGTCLYRLYYSFLFFTKGRQPILVDALAERLPALLKEICDHYEYDLVGCSVRPNQLQIVLGVKPTAAPSETVGNIKRGAARLMFEHFLDLETQLGKRTLWAEGYFVESYHWKGIEPLLRSFEKGSAPHAKSEEKPVNGAPSQKAEPLAEAEKKSLSPRLVESLLEHLLPTEQQVLTLLYGLRGERARPLEQVAVILTMKAEEVKQIEADAIEKLRELVTRKKPTRVVAS